LLQTFLVPEASRHGLTKRVDRARAGLGDLRRFLGGQLAILDGFAGPEHLPGAIRLRFGKCDMVLGGLARQPGVGVTYVSEYPCIQVSLIGFDRQRAKSREDVGKHLAHRRHCRIAAYEPQHVVHTIAEVQKSLILLIGRNQSRRVDLIPNGQVGGVFDVLRPKPVHLDVIVDRALEHRPL